MKKKTFLILTIAVVVVTAIIVGSWVYQRMVPNSNVQEYNTYATAQAYSTGLIGQNDILILHSINRAYDGDSTAEFYIYRLPDGASAVDYLNKTTSQIGDTLEHMGTASCIFVGDAPTQVRNLTAVFLR